MPDIVHTDIHGRVLDKLCDAQPCSLAALSRDALYITSSSQPASFEPVSRDMCPGLHTYSAPSRPAFPSRLTPSLSYVHLSSCRLLQQRPQTSAPDCTHQHAERNPFNALLISRHPINTGGNETEPSDHAPAILGRRRETVPRQSSRRAWSLP